MTARFMASTLAATSLPLEIRLDLVGHGGGALVEVDQQRARLVHGAVSYVHPRRRALTACPCSF
jgi:hypothetical protein